ncbi:MAG: hypothetical protein AAF206_12490, partial [Bacteroidota bacterium]
AGLRHRAGDLVDEERARDAARLREVWQGYVQNGAITISDAPGLGFEINEAALEKFTLKENVKDDVRI